MKKENFSQNMKDRMQQFEDGGLRLLKKGQKGIVHAIFSRFGLVLLLMLLQVGVQWSVFRWFGGLLPHYFGGSVAMSAFMVVYILNSEMDNSAKITWMVTIAILPVVGVPLFFYVKSNIGHNALKKRVTHLTEEARGLQPQPLAAAQELAETDPGAASLARYLHGKGGGFSVYRNTEVTYFPGGEAKFEELLRQLEKAEEYIFLEYFIIDEGLMWGKILEVLARKAAEGVDVRGMYDGTCEFSTLPHDYPRRLAKLGIKCKAFAPVVPLVSTHYNYRDHRKILVIDGHTAFNGGVNLADEYINRKKRFGVWKDTGLMLRGSGVYSLTALFLETWDFTTGESSRLEQFTPTLRFSADGMVQPYGDSPLDEEAVAENVYFNILQQATDYVYIATHYLVVDNEIISTLSLIAKSGVDVRIITPGIPDKKYVYWVTQSYYSVLMKAGVRIFEYSPGFIHAKMYVSDDKTAVVGSANMDYRSLYLHFECGALLLYNSQIAVLRDDVLRTLPACREVHLADCRTSLPGTLLDTVLRLLSPLM